MSEDILERAKKALIDDDMTYEDYDECISLLIAEVEAKRNLALDMLTKNKDLLDRAMRAEAEVERLRNLPRADVAAYDRRIQEMAARIKELESEITAWVADRDSWIGRYEAVRKEKDARIADQEAYIERLEAAFLDSLAARLYYEHYPGVSDAYSWHDYPEDACHCMPKEEFRKKAREALASIKEGGKG